MTGRHRVHEHGRVGEELVHDSRGRPTDRAIPTGEEEGADTRENRIRRFHEDPACTVMIANPSAAGEGISLHEICHNAIYLDRNYNAAQFLQSQDRIHRLGLAKNVITFIEILAAPDTVDESVHRRLDAKIANMARVLEDPSINVEPEVVDLDSDGFTKEDFTDLLGHVTRGDVA